MKKGLLFLAICIGCSLHAQKGTTYFGVQFKPIIPNRYIGEFEQAYTYDSVPFYDGLIRQRPRI